MRRWGVLISGRGSNLGALLDAREQNLDIRVVLSSNPSAHGLLRARRAGVPAEITPFVSGARKIDWVALDLKLRSLGVTHVFLAGFMKIVPASFVGAWRGRILNLHPSLLPLYPGLESIGRAYQDRKPMGLTVHEVNEEVDAGRIVCQRCCLKPTDQGEYPSGLSLAEAEFLIHVDEQRTIKEAVERWSV